MSTIAFRRVPVQILQICRKAAIDGGGLTRDRTSTRFRSAKGNKSDFLVDIHFMLNYPEARLRTHPEYKELLSAAHFGATRVIPTTSSVTILESIAQ
jgi:hypothetical protein